MNVYQSVILRLHSQSRIKSSLFLVSMPWILTMTHHPSAVPITFCENSSPVDPKKQKPLNNDKSESNSDSISVIMDTFKNINPQGIMNQIQSSIHVDKLATTLGSHVQTAIDSGVPTHLSYGFICGYSSGYALKKVGKIAGIVFGLGFITMQSLQYSGYIEIDHKQLKKDVEKVLDLDQDGTLSGADGKYGLEKVIQVLQYNVPGTGGFVAGFLGGLRSG